MKKQSKVLKALHSAMDELELLVIEGENFDLDIIEGIQERFRKLKKAINKSSKKIV